MKTESSLPPPFWKNCRSRWSSSGPKLSYALYNEPERRYLEVTNWTSYSWADPRHAESKPHAVSESESFCWTPPGAMVLEPTDVVDVGRRWTARFGRLTLPCSNGVVGWLATCCCSCDEPKSCGRLLLRFLMGAYFGGGISFCSNLRWETSISERQAWDWRVAPNFY